MSFGQCLSEIGPKLLMTWNMTLIVHLEGTNEYPHDGHLKNGESYPRITTKHAGSGRRTAVGRPSGVIVNRIHVQDPVVLYISKETVGICLFVFE